MPKIKNWSKLTAGYLPVSFAWKNDETGEVLFVGSKVPNDGYYVMVAPSDKCPIGHPKIKRVGFETTKEASRQSAISKIRENPDGFEVSSQESED